MISKYCLVAIDNFTKFFAKNFRKLPVYCNLLMSRKMHFVTESWSPSISETHSRCWCGIVQHVESPVQISTSGTVRVSVCKGCWLVSVFWWWGKCLLTTKETAYCCCCTWQGGGGGGLISPVPPTALSTPPPPPHTHTHTLSKPSQTSRAEHAARTINCMYYLFCQPYTHTCTYACIYAMIWQSVKCSTPPPVKAYNSNCLAVK